MALPNEVNVGTAPNNGTGDPLRTGGQKINANFVYLDENKQNISEKGAADGYVGLNANVKIGNEYIQMPVIPVETVPATGEENVLYTESSTANLKIWNGTDYDIYGGGSITYQDVVDALGFIPEPELGNPVSDDMVLASDTAGNRYWVVQESSGGGVTQQYVDDADAATLANAETYADSGDADLQLQIDDVEDDILLLESGKEDKSNKATDFSTVNNTRYPTTQATEGRYAKKNELYISVKEFNAVGDGTTDDSVAINNALTFASNNNIAIVLFEEGKIYRTSDFVFKPTNVSIDLNGSTIKLVDGLTEDEYPTVIAALEGNHNYTFIRNGIIDGNADNSIATWSLHGAGLGAEIYNDIANPTSHTLGTHVKVYNVIIKNLVRSNLVPGNSWDLDNIHLENSKYDHLLYFAGCKNVNVGHIYLTGFSYGVPVDFAGSNPAFNTTQPGGHTIKSLHLENVTTDSALSMVRFRGEFTADGSGLTTKAVKNVTINSVKIKDCTGFASIWQIGTSDGKCENITANFEVDSFFSDSGLTLTSVEKSKNIKVYGSYVIRSCNATTNMFMVSGNSNSIDSPDNIDISGSKYISLNNQGRACIALNRSENIRGLNASNVVYKNTNGSFLDYRDYQIYLPILFDFKYNGIYYDGDFFGNDIEIAGIDWRNNDNKLFGTSVINIQESTSGRIIDSYQPNGVQKFTRAIEENGNYVLRSRGTTQRDVMVIPFKENGHDIETSVIKIQTDEPLMTNGAKGGVWKLGDFNANFGANIEINGVEKVLVTEDSIKNTPRLYTSQQGFDEFALTDAATVNWDLDNQVARLLATSAVGNSRVLSISNSNPGVNYQLTYIQDATGGRELDLSGFDKVYGEIDLTADAESIITVCVTNAGTSFVVITSDVSSAIDNITEIPNRSYNDLQDLPTIYNGIESNANANADIEIPRTNANNPIPDWDWDLFRTQTFYAHGTSALSWDLGSISDFSAQIVNIINKSTQILTLTSVNTNNEIWEQGTESNSITIAAGESVQLANGQGNWCVRNRY